MVGGVGNLSARENANHLTNQLATLIRAEPHLLPAPGIVGSVSSVQILANDPYVSQTMGLFDQISLALLEIGSAEPSALDSGHRNASTEELAAIRDQGALATSVFGTTTATGLRFESRSGTALLGWL